MPSISRKLAFLRSRTWPIASFALAAIFFAAPAPAQTRILPIGDSITQGGQDHASYRYSLWFGLVAAGYDVDFVGKRTEIFGGGTPDPGSYPAYATSVDRQHEGRWGARSDQVLADGAAVASLPQPDLGVDPVSWTPHSGTYSPRWRMSERAASVGPRTSPAP